MAGHTDTHTDTQTHRHTHRQTGWKQYLATPSGGEVITIKDSTRWQKSRTHHVVAIEGGGVSNVAPYWYYFTCNVCTPTVYFKIQQKHSRDHERHSNTHIRTLTEATMNTGNLLYFYCWVHPDIYFIFATNCVVCLCLSERDSLWHVYWDHKVISIVRLLFRRMFPLLSRFFSHTNKHTG